MQHAYYPPPISNTYSEVTPTVQALPDKHELRPVATKGVGRNANFECAERHNAGERCYQKRDDITDLGSCRRMAQADLTARMAVTHVPLKKRPCRVYKQCWSHLKRPYPY